ncbi:MAG: hypothetical protein HWE27_11660 [Gammaproteobacteria bacterium]|nr:hypothetical protein [Gammaproteobacteria bacterium]
MSNPKLKSNSEINVTKPVENKSAQVDADEYNSIEATRLDYLSALGLQQWVVRTIEEDDIQDAAFECDDTLQQPSQQKAVEAETVQVTQNIEAQEVPPIKKVNDQVIDTNLSTSKQKVDDKAAHSSPRVTLQNPISENQATDIKASEGASTNSQKTHQGRGFLVLPNGKRWNPNSIAVVCRHKEGQPAESFLLRGNPSKTVKNLTLALQFLLEHEVTPAFLNRINFAQLATTALSDRASSTGEVITQHEPRAMLILGEETANLISGENRRLSEWQLKVWHTPEQVPFVVTYHPHDIFRNPAIKRQVYQDLIRLSDVIGKTH